jgi:hypothetical protein
LRAASINLISLFRRVAQASPDIKSDFKQLRGSWNELARQISLDSEKFPIIKSQTIATALEQGRIKGQDLANYMSHQAKILCKFIDAVINTKKHFGVKVQTPDTGFHDHEPSIKQRFTTLGPYEFYKFTEAEDLDTSKTTTTSYYVTNPDGEAFGLTQDSNGKHYVSSFVALLPDLNRPIIEAEADSLNGIAKAQVKLIAAV